MKRTIEYFDNVGEVERLTFAQKVSYASRLQAVVKVLNSQISSIKDDIASAHSRDFECVNYKVTHLMSTVYTIPDSVKKPYGHKKEVTKVTIR